MKNSKKCISTIYIILFLVLTVVSCSSTSTIIGESESINGLIDGDLGSIGNTPANSYNFGIIAESDGWLYGPMNNKLYKITNDGKGLQKLSDDPAFNVNVTGGYIYYDVFGEGDEPGIYRVKTDGTERELLNTEVGEYLYVINDRIFYSSIHYDYDADETTLRVVNMKTDGSSANDLVNEKVSGDCRGVEEIYVYNDWIYYISPENGLKLCRIRTDGSEINVISSQGFYYHGPVRFNIFDDWIYYSNLDDNRTLYKMRLDGSENTKITNIPINTLNVTEEWIFYSADESHFLYRVKHDGTENGLITDVLVGSICVADDYIYCTTSYASQRLKISIDGGEVYYLVDNEWPNYEVE